MIFIGFEELVQRDLQGMLDLIKYATADGEYKLYNDDEMYTKILEILPTDMMHEQLGIFIANASEELERLREMKGYAQAMIQNNAKPSTVLEVIDSLNVAELKQKLRRIEEIEAEMERANADNEAQVQADADARQERYMEFEKLLDSEMMNEEYDRKEDIEHIKGAYNLSSFNTGDSNENGIPDATEVQKLINDRDKIQTDRIDRAEKRAIEKEKVAQKKQEFQHQQKMDKENVGIQKEKNKIAKKKASQRPAAAKKR
jgi:hypothetical protein